MTFTTFILLTNNTDRILYRDSLPRGWTPPERLSVLIRGNGLEETRSVTPAELEAGLPLEFRGKPGDRLTVSYALDAPPDFAFAEDAFSPDLKPYALSNPPEVVAQGRDVVSDEWYQASALTQAQPLRTAARVTSADFDRLVARLYGGQSVHP